MDIGELLAFGVKNGASDMHLSAGMPPMIRVDGDMRKIDVPPMDNTTVRDLIYDIMNDKQQKEFEEFSSAISRLKYRGWLDSELMH